MLFDCLKIDRSFINDLPNNKIGQAIVSAALLVAESLGIAVIAEGIESTAQLASLRASGCAYG